MTGPVPTAPPGPPSRDDLTARLFRALYEGFDLHTVGGAHVAVAKGSPFFAGRSLSEVAWQISAASAAAAGPCRRADARQAGPGT